MGTHFEEVDTNFSKHCAGISVVSLRAQSDSDLDTDLHSQQPHVSYVCDDCTDSESVHSGESRHSFHHETGFEEVVVNGVSLHGDVTSTEPTDLLSLVRHVALRQSDTDETESDSSTPPRTPNTDINTLPSVVSDSLVFDRPSTSDRFFIVYTGASTSGTACRQVMSPRPDNDKEGNRPVLSCGDDEEREGAQPYREEHEEREGAQPNNIDKEGERTVHSDEERQGAQPSGEDEPEEGREGVQTESGGKKGPHLRDSHEEREGTQSDRDEGREGTPLGSDDEDDTEWTLSSNDDDEDTEGTQPGSDDDDVEEASPPDNDAKDGSVQSGRDYEEMLHVLAALFDEDLPPLPAADRDLSEDEDDLSDIEDDALNRLRQIYGECQICFEPERIETRSCCQFKVCHTCFAAYLDTKVSSGLVMEIQCPNFDCYKLLTEYEISTHLSHHLKVKYHKFLIDARRDPTEKTCPRCGHEHHLDKKTLHKKAADKKGIPVTCQTCALDWCFRCHAPWHEGVTCKEYRRGDREFRKWTRERAGSSRRQANAQKCPSCKVYIQRSTGCHHMTCTRCSTDFCYDCGKRYFLTRTHNSPFNNRVFRFLLGSHSSKLSPMGCSHNFLPERHAARRLIRGSVLGAKLVGGAVGVVLFGAVAVVGVVVCPVVWGAVKVKAKVRQRRLRALQTTFTRR